MRDIFKEVQLTIDEKEYTFRIQKMDAFTTSGLIKLLTEKLLPAISSLQDMLSVSVPDNATPEELKKITADRTQKILTELPKIMALIPENEFIELEKKCLKSVFVLLPAGPHPVWVNEDFGLEALKYDAMSMMALCFEVVAFNVHGFFGGSSLVSILNRFGIAAPKA